MDKIIITNCCNELTIKDNIKIKSNLINNDLNSNILNSLKNKFENKCTKYGFILKVINLKIDKEINIELEDNSCDAIFNVDFLIYTCLPIINDVIIVQVLKMENSLMIGKNGPLMCILKEQDNFINKKNFTNENGKIIIKATNIPLRENDYLEIIIK